MDDKPKRKARGTNLASIDKGAPAYRIIYGVFGGLTPFADVTGVPASTAHLWLTTGLIPARRQSHIIQFWPEGVEFDASLFVPARQAA